MPKRLEVASHLSGADLESRYSRCKQVAERDRLHCVLLKSRGGSATEISRILCKKPDWVRRTVRRYNEHGPDALADGRLSNGRARLFSGADEEALRVALDGQAPDGGLWTGPKVALWLAERTGLRCNKRMGWVMLRRLDFRVQRPRPHQPQADKGAQDAFKKGGLRVTWRASLARIPTP